MVEWITITAYPWIKALHVIAVISWMAGMLYLPRLFVYHCDAEVGSKQSETFKVMERRLLKAIINPAMIVTWLAGLYLAWSGHWFVAGWLHAKLALVIVLSGVHGFFSRLVKDFAADRNTRNTRFYRISFDILGEGARSDAQALGYVRSYRDGIALIGKTVAPNTPLFAAPGISGLLANCRAIFYIAEIPPHAGGCGCVPVSPLSRPPHQV